MRIALYQPDIAPNTGAIFRLAAVLGVEVDLIEPAGFVITDRRLKRVGLDLFERAPYDAAYIVAVVLGRA